MNKIFLINHLGNYALCFEKDKEKAEENFVLNNWLREFFHAKKTKDIKKELKTIELKEGEHYLTKHNSHTSMVITLKDADKLPIVICEKYPIDPLGLNMSEEDKRKIINIIKEIIKS